MRTRFRIVAASIGVIAGLSIGLSVAADGDPAPEPTVAPSSSTDAAPTTDSTTSTTSSTSTSTTTTTTTTTTVPTTTTTVPPATDDAPADGSSLTGPAQLGAGGARTASDPADGGATIEAPGDAKEPAHRSGEVVQLAEPPPTPTTTTLPPPDVLPEASGEGRRVVYSKTNMWVWMIEADETISRNMAVSGNRQWNLPPPGTYSVSSRSMHTCSIENPSLCWRYMVRFARGPNATWRDNIGFHEIPINTNTGGRVQNDWQLGEALSGGCVRMSTDDSVAMWNWAQIGTKVVVLP